MMISPTSEPPPETDTSTRAIRGLGAGWKHAVLLGGLLLGLFLVQEVNYLLFHSIAEMFSIVIATGLFFVVWNSRDRLANDFLLTVGVAYVFVASIDLLHTFAYAGMGVFPEYGTDLPTQLWLAARYLEATALVLGSAVLGRSTAGEQGPAGLNDRQIKLVLLGFAGASALLVASIFLRIFPDAYVEGVGLTSFKILSEYAIAGGLLVGLYLLRRHRDEFEGRTFRYLSAAIILTIAAEMTFTTYVNVYGFSNMVGHFLKIASYYFIYLAVIKTGISDPQNLLFRQLQEERDTLESREAQLERQNDWLEEFVSIVSHDLRNPLRAAEGRVELAREEHDTEHLRAVARSHDRMTTLIDDLLALARSGATVEDTEPVDLAEIAEESWAHLDRANADLVIETELTVRADPSKLQQLINNLLCNAITHGGEDVTITIGTLGEDNGFYVADDGSGVQAAQRDRVFDQGYTTSEDGMGLGLNIVNQIVQAHGWTIALTDVSDGGARFEVSGVEPAHRSTTEGSLASSS